MSEPNNEHLEKLIQEANRSLDMYPGILKNAAYSKPLNLKTGGQVQIPDAVNESSQNQRQALEDISNTARNTGGIHALLQTETEERKIADKENSDYTKRVERRNFWFNLLSLAVGITGLIIAVISMGK